MKLQRYDVYPDLYDLEVKEDALGDWCNADDVSKLEESHQRLLDALKAFIDYNDQGGPMSFDTDAMWAQARAAIAKAKERRYE